MAQEEGMTDNHQQEHQQEAAEPFQCDLERFRHRDRQVNGGRWRRVDTYRLDPPAMEDLLTMQRFATAATPPRGAREVHAADLVLDFDAHQPWLTLDDVWRDVQTWLAAAHAAFDLDLEQVEIAFSGSAGVHVTIPAATMGAWAHIELTAAYRRLAAQMRTAWGLVTLDAPLIAGERRALTSGDQAAITYWDQCVNGAASRPSAPPAGAALGALLAESGLSFFTRRRPIRRTNSRRRNGMYKVPLRLAEMRRGPAFARAVATQPRHVPLAPPQENPALSAWVRALLVSPARQTTGARSTGALRSASAYHDAGSGRWRPRADVHGADAATPGTGACPAETDAGDPLLAALDAYGPTPVCIRRLLSTAWPRGGSNRRLLTLASYLHAVGMPQHDARVLAQQALLRGVTDPQHAAERQRSAVTVIAAVYAGSYQFGVPFVRALGLVDAVDCAACPRRHDFARCRRER